MSVKIKLKYGNGLKEVNLASKNLLGIVTPVEIPAVPDELEEIRQALQNPIGSEPLSLLAKGKSNIIILVSDLSRPSPSHVILPPIIQELQSAGIKDQQITIVFALGNHRPHTPAEQKQLVGEEIYSRFQCLDHDPSNCVYIGSTSQGTPIELFQPLVAADLIIATGNLEFHQGAGYTGGGKALFPGVCSRKAIQSNHQLMSQPGTFAGIANGNPMREDMEEAAKIAGLDFMVNVVLNTHHRIIKAVAGDFVKAHRKGSKWVDRIYKCPIPALADLVLASCGGLPKDRNLYQAQKGLKNASHALKPGGIIILVAECSEGMGDPLFQDWMNRAKIPEEPIQWLNEKFILGAHKAAAICKILKKNETYLISALPAELSEKYFFRTAANLDEAINKAIAELNNETKILVLPYANSTLPFYPSTH